MLTDIQIAQSAVLHPIADIAEKAGIPADAVEPYGKYKAKIDPKYISGEDGKLILVTAITPTPAGEGKTTTTIGLADALRRLGKRSFAALREPSLGPVFGIKGGAAGGGYAQVVPMEDLNLHFTGAGQRFPHQHHHRRGGFRADRSQHHRQLHPGLLIFPIQIKRRPHRVRCGAAFFKKSKENS